MNCSIPAKSTISSNLRRTSCLAHPQDRAVQVDILPPGQFRVKTGTHFQQAGDAAFDLHFAAGWGRHFRKYLEQGAFARAVAANDPQYASPCWT